MSTSNQMAELSWREYADRIEAGAIVLVPVGALEQHGLHLPLGVDYMLAQTVAQHAAERVDAVVTPPLVFGYKSQVRTGGGLHFPGTVGLDGQTLSSLLLDVTRGLVRNGARKLAVIDGHYENQMFLAEGCDLAMREFHQHGYRDVKIVQARYFDQFDESIFDRHVSGTPLDLAYEHAGVFETSLFLHLFPELVDMDQAPEQEFREFPPYDTWPPPTDWAPETGALSDPNRATAELGEEIFTDCVNRLVDVLTTEFAG